MRAPGSNEPMFTEGFDTLDLKEAPRFLRKGVMGFLKNNPVQSSRAYPILSDASVFPRSEIGDTFDSCNIAHWRH